MVADVEVLEAEEVVVDLEEVVDVDVEDHLVVKTCMHSFYTIQILVHLQVILLVSFILKNKYFEVLIFQV